MTRYLNLAGNSPIVAFHIGAGHIDIVFRDGGTYRYTNASAGAQRIVAMKRLAVAGRGLATYITREAHDRYAERLA